MISKSQFKDRVWSVNLICRGSKALFDRVVKLAGDGTEIVIFPDSDTELNYYGLLYLDEHLVRFLKKDALIVTSNPGVVKAATLFTQKIKDIIVASDEEIAGLLRLYGTIDTHGTFVVVSMDKPEGRHADRLLYVRDLSVEQIVAIGVYFIIPFRPILRSIEYDGKDQDVLDILKEA